MFKTLGEGFFVICSQRLLMDSLSDVASSFKEHGSG